MHRKVNNKIFLSECLNFLNTIDFLNLNNTNL